MVLSMQSEIYQRFCEVIPAGVNSPVRAFLDLDQEPMIVESAFQDTVTDVVGNTFIDFCGSWGALIHGAAHPKILECVSARMFKGTSFGISCSVEEWLARKIVEQIDSVDKIRFVNSGTEACMSAARLARGFTGRDTIVKFNGNYHGHADFFLVQAGSGVTNLSFTSSSAGIPKAVVKDVVSLPYNDCETAYDFLRKNEVAAVIVEPIAGNMGVVPATVEFLKMLREETKNQGALLIFDEVITGFRVHLKGAQELFSISADLTCLGKVIGGGFPIAAFGGRRDVMNFIAPLGPVYQAGTLSGNPVAMEAGYQALCLLEREGFYQDLEKKTRMVTDPIRDYIKREGLLACIQQVGSMFTLFFGVEKVANQSEAKKVDFEKFAAFFRHMYFNGVYIPPSPFEAWFVSMAHTESHLEKTKNAVLKFLKELKNA